MPSRRNSTKSKKKTQQGSKIFKYEPGERVLCYEPDPSKARVLYEAKVS